MIKPRLRFPQYSDTLEMAFLHNIFKKIVQKNKGNLIMNVITNSAKEGLIPQREYFDKDVANKDNTEGYYIIEKGDFVYNPRKSAEAPYGPFGRYNFIDEGIVSPLYTCLKVIDKDKIDSDFLLYYFKSPAWHRYIYANGDTGVRHDRVSIKDENLLSMPIHIPARDEQLKIVQLFKNIDDVIKTIESDILLWEEKKKGVMQKIFSQEVRFKREDGSDYPNWEEKTFGDVFESLEYGMNTAAAEYDGVNKYIRITDIDDASHRYLANNVVSPLGELNDKYLVNQNDILFARTGASTGKSYLYRQEDGILYFAGFLVRGHVKSEFNSFFIFVQTLTEQYDKWVKVMSIRSGQPGINATEYALYKFMCPCFEEQCEIAELLLSVDEVIQIKKQKLEKWKNIKKGLLQQMFV